MKLKGKIAIVTGAGRGIGKAIALAYAKEGADVVVVSRTPAEIEETTAEIRALGQRCVSVRADVSNREDIEMMLETVLREFGKVDILINNAGIQGPIGPLVENDVSHWIKTVHVNLIGTFLCMRAVLPIMMAQRWGKIISLSGGGATSARPYFTAYAASKAAVVRLTETLAEELKDFNIQVNAIAPGVVYTRMLEEVLAVGEKAGEQALSEAKQRRETGGTPLGQGAALAVFLASEESDGLTGRLISTVWDNWQDFQSRIADIMNSELYTLRRVVK